MLKSALYSSFEGKLFLQIFTCTRVPRIQIAIVVINSDTCDKKNV